jgi:heavy metal sensor kinase
LIKSLPIRIRLSLWYFAIFATASCLLSTASWWMLQRSVDETEYHDLHERAEDVQLLLARQDHSQSIESLRAEFDSIYSIKDDGKWLQVKDQDGKWIYRSKRMIAENPELPSPDQIPARGVIAEFHQGTRYVRMLAYPIEVSGRRYSIQTGLALNKSMLLLSRFRTSLLSLTPVMIVLTALGGHWMSRKALQPIALLAAEARKITDRNLDTRLPVLSAKDEVSHLSETLNQMLGRIGKAFASVREFTGNASHELRTPIALLRAEIEVALIRPRTASEYKNTLLRLHEETLRMTSLVENLLSIARAEAGAETHSRIPIDARLLFERVCNTWQLPMERALIEFRTEIEPEDLTLLGDPTGISRLLSILLENAIKYTPPGGSVTLSARGSVEQICLSVRDTGTGISADDLPRIFDRFYRGSKSDPDAARGSGLGLALGKWIAERHGTRLMVDSETGRGSCFSFSLVRAAASSEIEAFSGLEA